MKKLFITIIMMSMIFFIVCKKSNKIETPFDSFMGAKWGINLTKFKKDFKYEISNKGIIYEGRYRAENILLGNIEISSMLIMFKKNPKDKQFYFDSVEMHFETPEFNRLCEVFVTKYGKPFTETKDELVWKNGDRVINLRKSIFEGITNEGLGRLYSIKTENEEEQEEQKKKNEDIKKAADIL